MILNMIILYLVVMYLVVMWSARIGMLIALKTKIPIYQFALLLLAIKFLFDTYGIS